MMIDIDKVKVKEAFDRLKLINNDKTQKLYQWCGRLEDNLLPDIEALHIKGFGLVNLPLESKHALELVGKFSPERPQGLQENTGKGCCRIDSSEITFIPRSKGGATPQQMLQEVTYTTLKNMLDIDFESLTFNIEAKLEKLVVCLAEESHQSVYTTQDQPGKFGVLLLQIPLMIDQPCGSVLINDGTQETRLKFPSNRCFSAAAVAGCCSMERKRSFAIESGPGDITAVMIFSLVWNDFLEFYDYLPAYRLCDLLTSIHAMKTALIAWSRGSDPEAGTDSSASDQEDAEFDEIRFLCIPVRLADELQKEPYSDISAEDTIANRSLAKINFVDVFYTFLQPEEVQRVANDGTASSFYRYSLEDELLIYPIFAAENFVSDVATYGFTEDAKGQRAVVIVIRLNSYRLSTRCDATLRFLPEIMIEDLESRIASRHTYKTIKENPYLLEIVRKDLEQVLCEMYDESRVATCKRCFLARLFNICIHLNATNLAQKLLSDIMKDFKNVKEYFICVGDCLPNQLEPTASFANFICFTKGWEECPDIMKHLMRQLLEERSLRFLCDIGLHLLNYGHRIGAREVLMLIVQAFRELADEPKEIDKMFHLHVIVLAIRLHEEDEPQREVLDELLDMMKHLEPTSLTGAVENLHKHLKEDALDCVNFMKKLGDVICETCFVGFNSQQFYTIVRVYSTIEEKFVKQFWKNLCIQCIQKFSGEHDVACLLCNMLEESKSRKTRHDMIDGLKNVNESKEALRVSLQKQRIIQKTFSINRHIEYIDCILLMEGDGQLMQEEIVDNLKALVSKLAVKDMITISSCLTRSKLKLICNRHTTMRKIAESLLIQISKQDTNAIFSSGGESILENFAWFGDVNLVKTVIDKLNESIANSTVKLADKLSMILKALISTEIETGLNAASSLFFSREVFNYLMLECLKALENLTNRTLDCVECFKLLASSERCFIDSTEPAVLSKWIVLSGSLTFLETADVVKAIFESEMNNEGPSLKKFPSCWKFFTELSNNVISKWDLNTVKEHLTTSHAVAAMQAFFWIGGEQGIVEFHRLISEVPSSVTTLANVHSAIIRDERTMELALSSSHGCLTLNDLIDARIETLSRKLAYLLTEDTLCSVLEQNYWGSSYIKQNRVNLPVPSFHFNHTTCRGTASSYTEKLETEYRWTDNTEMKKEIEELKGLRKKVLANILAPPKPAFNI